MYQTRLSVLQSLRELQIIYISRSELPGNMHNCSIKISPYTLFLKYYHWIDLKTIFDGMVMFHFSDDVLVVWQCCDG